MGVYIIIIIYKIINSPLLYYLLRHDCPEVGNPPQPAVQQKSASPPPPRCGRANRAHPVHGKPCQTRRNPGATQRRDNKHMLNVVTRRNHQTLFALAVMHA